MATVNPHKKFQLLLDQVIQFRAEVVAVDNALNRAQVKHGEVFEWVTSTITLSIGNSVFVENGTVIKLLGSLPYAEIEVS